MGGVVLGLDPWAGVYAVAVVLLAGILRGYSGFGFSALVMLALSLVVAPARLLPVVLLLEIAASVWMVPGILRSVDWRRLAWLLAGIALGTPAGVYALARVPDDVARLVLSGLVLAAAAVIAAGWSVPDRRGAALPAFTGLLAGVANGAAGVAGLVVVAMLLASGTAVATTRATLAAMIFATDVFAVAVAAGHGLVDRATFVAFAGLLLPLIAGVFLGSRLFLGTTPEHFRRLVLILLASLALVGIVRALA